MNKLAKGTLSELSISEIKEELKKIPKEDRKTSYFKEYFRNSIKHIVGNTIGRGYRGEEELTIEKINNIGSGFKDYYSNIRKLEKENKKWLLDEWPEEMSCHNKYDIDLIMMFSRFFNTIDDYEDFKNYVISKGGGLGLRNTFVGGKEYLTILSDKNIENFKSLFIKLNINTLEKLKYIMGDKHDLFNLFFIRNNTKTVERILGICNTIDDLGNLIFDDKAIIYEIFKYGMDGNFSLLFDHFKIKNKTDFISTFNKQIVKDVIINFNGDLFYFLYLKFGESFVNEVFLNGNALSLFEISNIEFIINLYNIKDLSELLVISDNKKIYSFLKDSEEGNLKILDALENNELKKEFIEHYCNLNLNENNLDILDKQKFNWVVKNGLNKKYFQIGGLMNYIDNQDLVNNNVYGLDFGLFISGVYKAEGMRNSRDVEKYLLGGKMKHFFNDFFIKKEDKFRNISWDNFTDFVVDENQVLFEFEKDKGVEFQGTKPWTKKWFLEDKKRKEYLKAENFKTFQKFGTIIGLGLIEGSQSYSDLEKFYEHMFSIISFKNNRGSILQIGEVFNLVLKKEKYQIFDELVEGQNIGTDFKEFIEDYNISDKGRTIITLMIAREIRDSFAIFKDKDGKEIVDSLSVGEMLKKVHGKLKKYRVEIDKYKDLPIKTSIGLEYEVNRATAEAYKEITGRDYVEDIRILSEYSGMSEGNDAVYEIATNPTDNPMLLILEMKLLEDLDFIDFNFTKPGYENGIRGLHITVGGEKGINLDENTNFIQNILIASNIGALNSGDIMIHDLNYYNGLDVQKQRNNNGNQSSTDIKLDIVGNHTNIRERAPYDGFIDVFGTGPIESVENRACSLYKKEQFERLVISLFNLNMACQLFTELHSKDDPIYKKGLNKILEISKSFYEEDDKEYTIMNKFIKLQDNIKDIIENHNKNFLKNEILEDNKQEKILKLFSIMESKGPIEKIMKKVGVDIYYLRSLEEERFDNIKVFEERLIKDGKDLSILTNRQKEILYGEYSLRIRKQLEVIKNEDKEIYDNIGDYFNGSIEDTKRRIENTKRFKEVIGDSEGYLDSLIFDEKDFFKELDSEIVQKLTKINNLFIKKDSTNALAMYDNTMESDGTIVSDRRLAETTIFDKLELGLKPRNGYNIIQGASENMIVQAIQREILNFNESIFEKH